jgi:hypothetical protein
MSNLSVALLLNRQTLKIRLESEKKIVYATIAYISKFSCDICKNKWKFTVFLSFLKRDRQRTLTVP